MKPPLVSASITDGAMMFVVIGTKSQKARNESCLSLVIMHVKHWSGTPLDMAAHGFNFNPSIRHPFPEKIEGTEDTTDRNTVSSGRLWNESHPRAASNIKFVCAAKKNCTGSDV